MQRIFISVLTLLSRLSHKRVIYINEKNIDPKRFATLTDYGFWFCGNVFDYADIAYGFASAGKIEEGEMDMVRDIIQHQKKSSYVFYDIGSNTGPYSLLAANTGAIVHSFDPVPEHLHILKQSIKLNGFEKNITTHQVALSNHIGTAMLTLSGTGSSLETEFLSAEAKPQLEVQLYDLDSYTHEHNLDDPDFIKIDVEGHEMQVVEGASAIISRAFPILFIEVARHLTDNGRSFHNEHYEKFFTFFFERGYEAYRYTEKGLAPFSSSFEESGAHMYLFLHKETHLKDASLTKLLGI